MTSYLFWYFTRNTPNRASESWTHKVGRWCFFAICRFASFLQSPLRRHPVAAATTAPGNSDKWPWFVLVSLLFVHRKLSTHSRPGRPRPHGRRQRAASPTAVQKSESVVLYGEGAKLHGLFAAILEIDLFTFYPAQFDAFVAEQNGSKLQSFQIFIIPCQSNVRRVGFVKQLPCGYQICGRDRK